jgi:hypothetical protein
MDPIEVRGCCRLTEIDKRCDHLLAERAALKVERDIGRGFASNW